MNDDAITIIQEDLAHDMYNLAASHREEIIRLMEDYDAHEIDTPARLDAYERDR